jgi:DNA-directed RNA polymerase specialized sigma24 family protein
MDLKTHLNEIHDQMIAGSRTASRDLYHAALRPLMGFLASQFPSLSDDALYDLASDAMMIYLTSPQGCDTSKSSLWSFLCRIAKADAIDLLRKTTNRDQLLSEKADTDVEFWATRAKDVFRDEDAIDARHIMKLHGHRLAKNNSEARVLVLMLNDENKTSAYAEALGLDPGSPDIERTVKQAKDRMLLRLKRLRDEL